MNIYCASILNSEQQTSFMSEAQLGARFLPRSTIGHKPRDLLGFVGGIVDGLRHGGDVLLVGHPLLIRGHDGRVCPVRGGPVNSRGLEDGA